MRQYSDETLLIIVALLCIPGMAQAGVTFFINDEPGWEAAVGGAANVEFFELTASNIALADEVASPPPNNTNLSTDVLTFDSANTPLSASFAIGSLDAPSFRYYDTFEVVDEAIQFNPIIFDPNDWDVVVTGGTVRAVGVDLISSDLSAGESISVFGASGLIGSTTNIPDGSHPVIFIGVVSDEPITRILHDENWADEDTIGVGDFRFSQGLVPVPAMSSGTIVLLTIILATIGVLVFPRSGRRISA